VLVLKILQYQEGILTWSAFSSDAKTIIARALETETCGKQNTFEVFYARSYYEIDQIVKRSA
jgi:hypothetical protein